MIPIDLHPSRRMLRNFGLIGLVAFPALAVLFHEKPDFFGPKMSAASLNIAMVALISLGCYCGLCALAAPRLLWPLYVFLTVVFYPIGFVLSYIVLAIMFYLIITPLGIVFKIVGRDAMTRRFDPAARTYWVKRRPPETVKRYFRQF